jgi:tetratricopeptide (TPR) repeat protein
MGGIRPAGGPPDRWRGSPVTGVYFVELGGDEDYEAQVVVWRHEVERVQLQGLQPWFPAGVAALQDAEVRRRVKALGQGVHEQVAQARRAREAPGNLRRHNPSFVGRAAELRALRHQLTGGGAVGVVTAVHGIGGMGKTELAVTYAHAYAHTYQGGTWQVDADGATDVLAAISALALSPELGLDVREEHLQDRHWLGRRVLARLGELTEAARARDADSAACLLLLDNVSEPGLLSESQLAVLPDQPWFHLAVTTRLGVGDLGTAGTRGSVAMIEVGRLATEDAVALIREHQPARDPARLHTEFSSPAEQDAARHLVDLLDGYTLAVEQAAIYLGSSGVQPSQLLALLRAHGITVLDDVGSSADAGAILHKEKIAGVIVDQTLARLPPRATKALALACLLPPDTIPWSWLDELTDTPGDPADPPRVGLPGSSGDGDWTSTRRILEGRRLLTLADDPRLARLHRVLGEHLRTRLADSETDDRLDTHLQQVSHELADAATPDTALLAVTATTITGRLTDGRHDLAEAGDRLIDAVQQRLDLTTAHSLATATLTAAEHRAGADPDHPELQHDLASSLNKVGEVLAARGDTRSALEHHTRALHIDERLAAVDPDHTGHQRDLASSLYKLGALLAKRGDTRGALDHCTRAVPIVERLIESDPDNAEYQRYLSIILNRLGGLLAAHGDTEGALEHFIRSLHTAERLTAADPDNTRHQRDVWVCHYQIASALESVGDPSAADHWGNAHRVLAALDAAGKLPDSDQATYDHVTRKLGPN